MTTFREDFTTGIAGYTLVSGNLGIFTVVTDAGMQALNIASQSSGTVSNIRKAFSTDVTAPNRFTWNVKLTALNTDDGGLIVLTENNIFGPGSVAFNSARENFYDSLRRPRVYVGGTEYIAAPAALTLNQWYSCSVDFVGSAFTYKIVNMTTGVLVHQFNGTSTPASINRLDFNMDSGLPTSATRYANIVVSNDPASISQSPVLVGQQFFDNEGKPLAFAQLYTNGVSSGAGQVTYSDFNFTENTNPIILDEFGRMTTNILLDDSKGYHLILYAAEDGIPIGDPLIDIDYVTGINSPLILT